jgi:hypothetical protein
LPRLPHLRPDAGYTGREDGGVGRVEKALGWGAEMVKHPPKRAPEEAMMGWIGEFDKEWAAIDPKESMPEQGPRPFPPKRWVVGRTISWLGKTAV